MARRLRLEHGMGRLGLVLVLVLLVVVGLVASGVISVHVDVHPPTGVRGGERQTVEVKLDERREAADARC